MDSAKTALTKVTVRSERLVGKAEEMDTVVILVIFIIVLAIFISKIKNKSSAADDYQSLSGSEEQETQVAGIDVFPESTPETQTNSHMKGPRSLLQIFKAISSPLSSKVKSGISLQQRSPRRFHPLCTHQTNPLSALYLSASPRNFRSSMTP